MANILAQGTVLSELPDYEGLLEEGQKAEVTLYLTEEVGQEVLDQIYDGLVARGVVLTDDVIEALGREPKISIRFQKAIAPLVIIAGVIGGIVFLPFIVWQWRLALMPPGELIKTVILPIGLLAVGGIVLIAVIMKPEREAAVKVAPEVVKALAARR